MSGDIWVQTAMFVLPVLFVAMWLLVGFLMPRFMGWSKLEVLFPDRPVAQVIDRHHFQALYLAKPGARTLGPSYRGCVILEACDAGLRISIWKVFQPFSKPIFIPWEDIEAVTNRVVGIKVCSLKVGPGDPYTLSIIARVARKIEKATGGKLNLPADLA